MKILNSIRFPFIISLALLVCVWLVVTEWRLIDKLFLPTVGELSEAFYALFREKAFGWDIAISMFRVWVSFLLSLAIAIPLALLMSESKVLKRVLLPYIDFIRYLPVPALIPLSILFLGIDESAKIALLFVGTFFQFILMILDDLKNVPREFDDVAFTLQFSAWNRLFMRFRAILPQIYDNSRISIGICWTYLIIAELVASENGIGHMIKEAQRFSQTADIYAGIITIGIIGFLTDAAFRGGFPFLFRYLETNGLSGK